MVTKILVTGGSGMLGGELVTSLSAAGYQVHSLDIRPSARNDIPTHLADVRDTAAVLRAVDGMDAVVHTASALPTYPVEEIDSIVLGGTRSVLAAAKQAGTPRVVHISSTAVYGLPKIVPTTEAYGRQPVDPYSRAKAKAEEIVEEFRDAGVRIPVLRPKTFVGPGRMGLFSMLFEWAEEGRSFPVLGRGDVRIQMLAVEDLVRAVHTVLSAPIDIADDYFNIAAVEFGTIREDFQAVLDAAGHGRRVVPIPAKPAVAVLGLLQKARLSPVYDRLLHKLLADSYVCCDKARDVLGFVPERSNRDAILRTYAWWRDQRGTMTAGTGRTSREPWRQGALSLVKAVF